MRVKDINWFACLSVLCSQVSKNTIIEMYYVKSFLMALFMHNIICILVFESNSVQNPLLIDSFKN